MASGLRIRTASRVSDDAGKAFDFGAAPRDEVPEIRARSGGRNLWSGAPGLSRADSVPAEPGRPLYIIVLSRHLNHQTIPSGWMSL